MKHLSLRSGSWIATLILCIGMTIHANAQTFTDRVQKKEGGKGTVTIHQSTEIDQLVNDPNATGVEQPSKTNEANKVASPKENNQQTQNSPATNNEEKPTATGRKITGYRVQAFAGGNSRKDRQMAEQARNNIKAKIPNASVYVHFYSPRWICRVGNYRTYEEAHQMMVKLQNMGYKQASIVKGTITVPY